MDNSLDENFLRDVICTLMNTTSSDRSFAQLQAPSFIGRARILARAEILERHGIHSRPNR